MASTFNEHQLQLAFQSFERNPQLDIYKTIQLYKILHSILSHRINSRSIYIDIIFNLRKLIILKEEIIVRKVFDLDSRRFPPRIYDIEDITNRLLTTYNTIYIGPY